MCSEPKVIDARTALRLNRLTRASNSLDLVGSDPRFLLQNCGGGSADPQKCDWYFSHEMLSSNGSSTDQSGHTASSSKTSLNSAESYDTMLNRKYSSSLSGSQTNINARQLRLTERKSSVPETSLENKGHSHLRKPKKDVRRAEIVAAVTRRLYTTKKRPDGKIEPEEPVKEEKFEDEDDEPEELKLCARARARLQEISKRAMNVPKKMKNADTQTDLMPTLRVKDAAVNTYSSGIVRTADVCLHTNDSTPIILHKETAVNTDLEGCASFQNRLKGVRCSCFRKSLRTVLYKEASVSTASADHDGHSDTFSISEESVNYTDDFTPDKSRFRDYCGSACHSVAQLSNSKSSSKFTLCPFHTDPLCSRETCWDFSKNVGTQADNFSSDIVKCCPTKRAESSVQTSWMQETGTNTEHNPFITTVGVQTTTDVAVNTDVSAVNSPLIQVKDTLTQSDEKITQTHEAIDTISDTFGSFFASKNKSPLTFYALRKTTGTVTDTALWTTSLCEKYYLNVLSRSRTQAVHAQQLKRSNLIQRAQDKQPVVNHSRNNTQDDNFSDDSLESQQSAISYNVEVVEPEINEELELVKANRTKSRKDVRLQRSKAPLLEIPNNRNPVTLSQKTDTSNHICCRKLQPDFQSHSYHCPREASFLRNCCLHDKNTDNEIFLRNRRSISQNYSPTCKMKDCYCECRNVNPRTIHSNINSRTKSYVGIPTFNATKEYANDGAEYPENHIALNVCTDFESELENQEVVSPDFSISQNSGEKDSCEVTNEFSQTEKKGHELQSSSVSRCDCVDRCRNLRSTPHHKTKCIPTQHVSCHSIVPDGNSTPINKNINSSTNRNFVQPNFRNVCGRHVFTNRESEMTDPVSEFKLTVPSNISQESVNRKMGSCKDMPQMRFPLNTQEELEFQSDVNDHNEILKEQAVHHSPCTSHLYSDPINEDISLKKHKSDMILTEDLAQCDSSASTIRLRTNQKGECHTETSHPSLQSTGKLQEGGTSNVGVYSDLLTENNNFRTKMHIVEETIITNSTEPFSNPEIPESRLEFTIMSDSINVHIRGRSKQVQSSNGMRRNNFNSVKSENGTQTSCTYDNKHEYLGKDSDVCKQEITQIDAIPKSDVSYSNTLVQRGNIKCDVSSSPSISVEQAIFKDDQESFKNAQEESYSQICSPVVPNGNETNQSSFKSQQNKVENGVLASNDFKDSEERGNSSERLSNNFITDSSSGQKKSNTEGDGKVQIAESNRHSHHTGNEQHTMKEVSTINPTAAKKRVSKKKLRSHLPLHGNRLSAGVASSLTTQGWGNAGAVGTWFTLSAFVRKASSLLRNLTEVTQMMENTKKIVTGEQQFESNTSYALGASPLFPSKGSVTAIQSARTASYESLVPDTARPAETRNFTFGNKETLVTNGAKHSELAKVVSADNKNVRPNEYSPRKISSAPKLYNSTAHTHSYTADVFPLPVNTNLKAEVPQISYSDYCTYTKNSTTGIEDWDIVENSLKATKNVVHRERISEGSFECSNNTHENAFSLPSVKTEPLLPGPLNSESNKNTTSHYMLKLSGHTLVTPPENDRTVIEDNLQFLHHPENIDSHDEDQIYISHNDIRAQFPWAPLNNSTSPGNCFPDPKTSIPRKSLSTTHKNVTGNSWDSNMSADKLSVISDSHLKAKNDVKNSSSSKSNRSISSPITLKDNDHCCFGNILTTLMNYHQQKNHQCPLSYQSSSDVDRTSTSAGVIVPTYRANFISHLPKTNVLRDSGTLTSKNIVIDAPRPTSDYNGCSPRAYKQYLLSVRRKIATDSGYSLKTGADNMHTDNVNKY